MDGVDQDQNDDLESIVKVGKGFACALDNKGEIHCFGDSDGFGQISNSPNGLHSYLDVGFDQACAIDQQGSVTCWGRNNVGQTDTPTGTFQNGFCWEKPYVCSRCQWTRELLGR